MTPIQFIQHHTYISIGVAWIISNVASALPSPKVEASGFYRWFYAFMHLTFGMVPRMIATMFPAFAQFLNISTLQTPASRVTAFAAQAESDMSKTPSATAVTTIEQTTATVVKENPSK
jgi:hypothetical protein